MQPPITYQELDRLAGELLPVRAALSVLASPIGGGTGASTTAPAPAPGDGGPTAVYACEYTHSPGTPGLLGTGLAAEAPYTHVSCVPAAVTSDA